VSSVTQNIQKRIRQAVEWHSGNGIPVFPVHSVIDGKCTCSKDHAESVKQIGKHPATKHGLKDATSDYNHLLRMFPTDKLYNIGMPTGAASGIIVVDLDGEKGEATFRQLEAKHGALPDTRQVKTGNGRHYYFKAPEHPLTSFSNPETKIDLRAEGGYVLVPPSLHRLGAEYQILKDVPVVAAPDWLTHWLESEGRQHAKSSQSHTATFAFLAAGMPDYLKSLNFPIIELLDSESVIPHTQKNEAALKDALNHIDANCGRDIWLNALMGIKSLHFVDGWNVGALENIAHDWSKTGNKEGQYNEADFLKTWHSLNKQPAGKDCVTVRTVIFHARNGGWTGNLRSGDSTDNNAIEAATQPGQNPAANTILRSYTLYDFLNLKIPPRELILSPIIPTQGLVMLYAPRGIGKTFTALSIALSVATGSSMLDNRWRAEKPRRVLLIDGEMPATVLQTRLKSLQKNFPSGLRSLDFLRIITPDVQDAGIPDLSTTEGQQAIEQQLDGIELVILDNLSSLCRSGKENEAESWMIIQSWLLSLRKRGISALLVHHANKSGGQRGTSKKEDLLDTVITLKQPIDYNPTQGARFEVHYEKARGFYGEEAKPFEASLTDNNGVYTWVIKNIDDSMIERIMGLKQEGLTQREIAKEVGSSPATVNRILKNTAPEIRLS